MAADLLGARVGERARRGAEERVAIVGEAHEPCALAGGEAAGAVRPRPRHEHAIPPLHHAAPRPVSCSWRGVA